MRESDFFLGVSKEESPTWQEIACGGFDLPYFTFIFLAALIAPNDFEPSGFSEYARIL